MALASLAAGGLVDGSVFGPTLLAVRGLVGVGSSVCGKWDLVLHSALAAGVPEARALDAQEQVHAGDVWPEGAAAEYLGGALSCSAATGFFRDMRMQLHVLTEAAEPAPGMLGHSASSCVLIFIRQGSFIAHASQRMFNSGPGEVPRTCCNGSLMHCSCTNAWHACIGSAVSRMDLLALLGDVLVL